MPYDSYAGRNGLVTGWGWDSDSHPVLSPVLREVDVPIITYDECVKLYYVVNPDHICTSGVGGKGSCFGDSGGPLVVDDIQVNIKKLQLFLLHFYL